MTLFPRCVSNPFLCVALCYGVCVCRASTLHFFLLLRIALTAMGISTERDRALEAGMDDFVPKVCA